MFNLSFDPVIVRDVLDDRERKDLHDSLRQMNDLTITDSNYNRRLGISEFINELAVNKIAPMAKDLFRDRSLKMTYSLYCKYDSPQSRLPKHRDDNACTYTIDYCVSARTSWPLWVEDKEYVLGPNEALVFLGEDQTHWREEFPDAGRNVVEMLFFHFAPQDHWYFTKGPRYIDVLTHRIEQVARAHGVDPVDIHKVPNYRSLIYF